jgi:hypothetical protein
MQQQAEFLFAVLKHTPTKLNTRHLAAQLNLKVGATNMRMTRLKKKLAASAGVKGVKAEDLDFLLKVVEMGGGKTDIKGLAEELGMKYSAVNMRLTRMRRKFGRPGGSTGVWGSKLAEEVAMDEGGGVKQEEGVIEVKCEEEGNW